MVVGLIGGRGDAAEGLDVDKGRSCLLADEAQGHGRQHERARG